MEEMPKYKVGDLVGFWVHSKEKENHVGQIVAIAYGNVYDIRSNINGVYYRVKEENITYRILDTDNKEILKRMVNDYNYGLFPGYDREAIKKHFEEAVKKQQIRETIRKDLINLHLESEEKNTDIRYGDIVGFRYVGEFFEGIVTKIRYSIGGSVYVDIDCGGGSIITCYPADNITSNSSAERRREAKTRLNSIYGADVKLNYLPDKKEKKVYTPNIKINQTEITGGDRKGIYSTVFFNDDNTDPVTIKKSEDTSNDILLAIAYAWALRNYNTNSKFKKRVDKETVKMGNDYVVKLGWRVFFVPGEILKRKRWDIYTYVAVQLLFRIFSIKDVQDAIENCTYTKKEK